MTLINNLTSNLASVYSNSYTQTTQKIEQEDSDKKAKMPPPPPPNGKRPPAPPDSTEISEQGQALNKSQDVLSGLISDGTLTDEQATSVQSSIISAMQSGSSSNPLASLISNGTITQDQASAINNAFMQARQEQ